MDDPDTTTPIDESVAAGCVSDDLGHVAPFVSMLPDPVRPKEEEGVEGVDSVASMLLVSLVSDISLEVDSVWDPLDGEGVMLPSPVLLLESGRIEEAKVDCKCVLL